MLRLFTVLLCALLLTGCGSGGGGGSGSGYLPNSGPDYSVPDYSVPDYSGPDYSGPDYSGPDSTSTPEPSTLILLGIGLAGLAAKMLIKKRTR